MNEHYDYLAEVYEQSEDELQRLFYLVYKKEYLEKCKKGTIDALDLMLYDSCIDGLNECIEKQIEVCKKKGLNYQEVL